MTSSTRAPYGVCAVVGLGGLFAGITGPLLSAFIPPLVRDVLGDQRTAIGSVMAIDNVLLLALVPWIGAVSDAAAGSGRGRLPLILAGFGLAAVGMAAMPWATAAGLFGLIAAMVVLHAGINIQRAPFQALQADLVPSPFRSLASASATFQMCAGAIVFLMLGQMLGMRPAFLIAAGSVLLVAVVFAVVLREPQDARTPIEHSTWRQILDAFRTVVRGAIPGVRAIFVAALLLQLIFQTFTTWFALHGTERFGVPAEQATIGFIAWAMGGVVGALPAGAIGMRIGRRNAMLLGFGLMAVCLIFLDRATSLGAAVPWLALASASWTLPTVNAYPLFVEPIPRERRGVLAAMYLLSMALGGMIGDPLNGRLFDMADGYRPMFQIMAVYTALAFVAIWLLPKQPAPLLARPFSSST